MRWQRHKQEQRTHARTHANARAELRKIELGLTAEEHQIYAYVTPRRNFDNRFAQLTGQPARS